MKKIFLSTLLAVLMLVQMVPMTVLAAETTGDTIKDTITSTSGFTTVERENKNGSKTTVITFDGKSVEITNYENAQVIVEKETNKMPKMTIVVSSKVTDKIMIEVPVNLGKYFKTNWVNVSYLDGNTDFAFAKYVRSIRL